MSFCSHVPQDYLQRSRVIRRIGFGSFSKVELIIGPDQQEHAVKSQFFSLPGTIGIERSSLLETDILVRFRNIPQIVRLDGVCVTPVPDLRLIMERLDYSLQDLSETINFETKRQLFPKLFQDLILGVASLEAYNYHHFDIKPTNVMIKNNNFKLIDFGLAFLDVPGINTKYEIVTVNYRSPELLLEVERLGPQIDIWSVGVTLAEFLLGRFLFNPMNGGNASAVLIEMANMSRMPNFVGDIQNRTARGQFPVEYYVNLRGIPDTIQNVFKSMFNLNPAERPTATQIARAFGWIIPTPIIPPEGLRRTGEYVRRIINFGNDHLSPTVTLMAIEIATRYGGYPGAQVNSAFIAAICHLAEVYLENDYITLTELGGYFGAVGSELAERIVLHILEFRIYNPRLTPKVNAIFNHFKTREEIFYYLKSLPLEYFSQNIDLWFT